MKMKVGSFLFIPLTTPSLLRDLLINNIPTLPRNVELKLKMKVGSFLFIPLTPRQIKVNPRLARSQKYK